MEKQQFIVAEREKLVKARLVKEVLHTD